MFSQSSLNDYCSSETELLGFENRDGVPQVFIPLGKLIIYSNPFHPRVLGHHFVNMDVTLGRYRMLNVAFRNSLLGTSLPQSPRVSTKKTECI